MVVGFGSIPDNDHVARYCKPSTVSGEFPTPAAFLPDPGEGYLSCNWLEYLVVANLSAAVDQLRQVFNDKGYTLRRNGRFAVLDAGVAKRAVWEGMVRSLTIKHIPEPNDLSHAGILGYTVDDLTVAIELTALVTSDDSFPAIP